MSDRLIFSTHGAEASAAALGSALDNLEHARVETFASITEMRRQMRSELPDLIIGPWSDSGITLLGARSMLASPTNAPEKWPFVLALTEFVTPAKIALAQSAGSAELIPTRPFEPLALRNRVLLLLEGAAALASRLHDDSDKFETALENLPALRRRLAA